jgi:hypothetical protein
VKTPLNQIWCKRKRGLIGTLKLCSHQRPYFARVFLWRTTEDLARATGAQPVFKGKDHGGLTVAASYSYDIKTGDRRATTKCLAEVHFASDGWDISFVAHELSHVMTIRMALLGPDSEEMLKDSKDDETIAYEIQAWTKQTYLWLWDNCPRRQGKLSPELRQLL